MSWKIRTTIITCIIYVESREIEEKIKKVRQKNEK